MDDPEGGDLVHRITPAWAGKRFTTPEKYVASWDHPRVGGEKIRAATNHSSTLGSPPRGRGKVVRSGVHRCCRGITPAWAGKRQLWRLSMSRHWDHPRVGGEKKKHTKAADVCPGSPPRGRGKDAGIPILAPVIGITPAWAGKSHIFKPFRLSCGDHPRVGGEKNLSLCYEDMQKGSPPRGRGKEA